MVSKVQMGGVWEPRLICERQSIVAILTLFFLRSYEEAEKLLEAALPAAEAISGDDHPRVALILQTLAGVFARTRRISFAEGLYK